MTRWLPLILTTIILFFNYKSSGQTDTINYRAKYNYVDYYSPGKVKSHGNNSDSLRTGIWTFYKPDGTLLAKGHFVKGIAKGKWVYFDYNGEKRTYNWNWRKGFKPGTTLELREGKLYIKQSYIFSNGVFRTFENGKYQGGGKF